jgi:hypothetical protein
LFRIIPPHSIGLLFLAAYLKDSVFVGKRPKLEIALECRPALYSCVLKSQEVASHGGRVLRLWDYRDQLFGLMLGATLYCHQPRQQRPARLLDKILFPLFPLWGDRQTRSLNRYGDSWDGPKTR